MKYNKIQLGIVALLLLIAGCKTPFQPEIKEGDVNDLVVEGFINGNGLTTITLSRTREITPLDTADRKYESLANVMVQDNLGNAYQLYASGQGEYSSYMSLRQDLQYRLHIFTRDGREYVSSYVPLKVSPPIGNLVFKREGNKVDILLNTYDPFQKSTYYRWDYTEIWEYHSKYDTKYKYIPRDTIVVERSDRVHVCWMTKPSNKIVLATTSGLAEDKIDNQTIQTIYNDDERLSVLYSIQVNQYVLDSAAFNYWQAMQKYSEDMGGLFDPQPDGNIKGNITCVSDSSEDVIGYISAGIANSRRLFIPRQWDTYLGCPYRVVPSDSLYNYFDHAGDIPFEKVSSGWKGAYGSCVDCTLKGGSTVKPNFWP